MTRYLVKTRQEMQGGGKSVAYLMKPKGLKVGPVDPNTLPGLVDLFGRVSTGYH